MIHYQLICSADHGFDGWFRDIASFEHQAKSGLVVCPVCGDLGVHRALMAPAIGRTRAAAPPAEAAPATIIAAPAETTAAPGQPAPGDARGMLVPDQVRAMLQKLRAEVEKTCEHVGDRFAQEALAIHRGETEARPIYGEATPEQAEALADDGIEIARIPWIPRADG